MYFHALKRPVLAVSLLASLSACVSNTFDTNTTTEAEFNSAFASADAMTLSNPPILGSATYEGEMQITTMDSGTETGTIRGDLVMEVTFLSQEPMSAEAGGFAGTINGERVTYSGTLSSADAPGLLPINAIVPLGTYSTLWLTMGGTLRNDATGVRNKMEAGTNLQGEFRNDGETITGDVNWSINPRNGVSAITGTSTRSDVDGEFYAHQQ